MTCPANEKGYNFFTPPMDPPHFGHFSGGLGNTVSHFGHSYRSTLDRVVEIESGEGDTRTDLVFYTTEHAENPYYKRSDAKVRQPAAGNADAVSCEQEGMIRFFYKE